MIKPFEIIATDENISPNTRVKLISMLSRAIGYEGMIGGQVLDVQNETRQGITEDILVRTCAEKTGALIESACAMGCICAESGDDRVSYALEYAKNLGLAFQIIDDILDVIGDKEVLGKPIGSDKLQNKTTFVTLLGLDGAKAKAKHYTNLALKSLDYFENNEFLVDLTNSLLDRQF
jgi:geranylgeranyl diphosphate synthase type II